LPHRNQITLPPESKLVTASLSVSLYAGTSERFVIINQHYIHADNQRRGMGSPLVELAKKLSTGKLQL
jgi:hypothetical protein